MADNAKAVAPDFASWCCPLPLADYPTIVMGHGGGGKLGNELVEHLFLPAFRNPALENLGDAAVLETAGARLPIDLQAAFAPYSPLLRSPGEATGQARFRPCHRRPRENTR